MKIDIINNCSKTYRPDHIKVTNKILNRIPEKYLENIAEIRFWDKSNDPIAKQIPDKDNMESAFDIYWVDFLKTTPFQFRISILFSSIW